MAYNFACGGDGNLRCLRAAAGPLERRAAVQSLGAGGAGGGRPSWTWRRSMAATGPDWAGPDGASPLRQWLAPVVHGHCKGIPVLAGRSRHGHLRRCGAPGDCGARTSSRATNARFVTRHQEPLKGLLAAEAEAWIARAAAADVAEDALSGGGDGPPGGRDPGRDRPQERTAGKLARCRAAQAEPGAQARARQEQAGAERARRRSRSWPRGRAGWEPGPREEAGQGPGPGGPAVMPAGRRPRGPRPSWRQRRPPRRQRRRRPDAQGQGHRPGPGARHAAEERRLRPAA